MSCLNDKADQADIAVRNFFSHDSISLFFLIYSNIPNIMFQTTFAKNRYALRLLILSSLWLLLAHIDSIYHYVVKHYLVTAFFVIFSLVHHYYCNVDDLVGVDYLFSAVLVFFAFLVERQSWCCKSVDFCNGKLGLRTFVKDRLYGAGSDRCTSAFQGTE